MKNAFQKVEQLWCISTLFELYDVTKDIVLNCDASADSIGSVLSQIVESKKKTIAFASKILNKTKQSCNDR